MVNLGTRALFQDLNLPIACKNYWAECDFSGDIESVVTHEEDCPYRGVPCVVLNCTEYMLFNMIENHMAEKHAKMSNGQWQIIPVFQGAEGVLAQARLNKTEIESDNVALDASKRKIEVKHNLNSSSFTFTYIGSFHWSRFSLCICKCFMSRSDTK